MKGALVVVFSALLCVCFASDCFILGEEQINPTGYISVTLDMLRSTTYGPKFIEQYNANGGISFVNKSLAAQNCLVTFGLGNCLYTGDTSNTLAPYINGTRSCYWLSSYYVTPVQLGGWYYGGAYKTLNSSVFTSWSVTQCAALQTHWTLYYDTSCGSHPTPPPTPPPSSSYMCCYYWSAAEKYETYFCQKSGYTCPDVSGFSLFGNATEASCTDCTLSKFLRKSN